MGLIDKEKVCKEIKRLIDNTTSERGDDVSDSYQKTGAYFVLNKLLHYIDTLEVKDVDLDKESMNYLLNEHKSPLTKVMHGVDLWTEMQYHKDIQDAFKAGFIKAVEG